MKKQGKEYELMIAQIYRELEGSAEVLHDQYITGLETGIQRQIDVTIRYKVAQIDMLIAVQAKDWKNKADVNVVGAFVAVLRDIRAQKGILICKSGFTKAAKDYAKRERIELYSAHDNINWPVEINIPVVRTEEVFDMEFKIVFPVTTNKFRMKSPPNFMIGEKTLSFSDISVLTFGGQPLDRSGKTMNFDCKEKDIFSDAMGKWEKIISLSYKITYKKLVTTLSTFTPNVYRALLDHSTGRLIHSFLNYEEMMTVIKEAQWQSSDQQTINGIKNASYIDLRTQKFGELYRYSFKMKAEDI
jgi:hypothetical protein